jgi:hypothetical protein
VEFTGAVTVDTYHQSTSSPSGNPTLSPLSSGTFSKGVVQGDLRSKSPGDWVNYVQATTTSTNDRSVQARYATQINNLQIGRTGPGFALNAGDVTAAFSQLSTNLGLRGALVSSELGAVTLSGVAGTVAESWEALTNRAALDGAQPRTRYLRDVMGVKGDYRLNTDWNVFVTVQNYADRMASANLAAGTPAFEGQVLSTGLKYKRGALEVSAEAAHARKTDLLTQTQVSDNAWIVDGTYKFETVNLRFGLHNLGAQFASGTPVRTGSSTRNGLGTPICARPPRALRQAAAHRLLSLTWTR